MATAVAPRSKIKKRDTGIRYWMDRVIAELHETQVEFAPDAVHDLRVAIRRCRSMAEGISEIDPNPTWKKMRKAGKSVFAALGELRDAQVLIEWVRQLREASPAIADPLLAQCLQREQGLKTKAAAVLPSIDERNWTRWAALLETRARRLTATNEVFQVIALQRWSAAHALHRLALRDRSKVSFHRLRIGIKQFRYMVENFLPEQHELWGADLKFIQDILGEVHDLDVLWETSWPQAASAEVSERERWHAAIQNERERRLLRYREKMLGPESPWKEWRSGLPTGEHLRKAIDRRFEVWAGFHNDHQAHSRHVAKLALGLYDSLRKADLLSAGAVDDVHAEDLLSAAALAHEAGRSNASKAHHKRTGRLMAALTPPPGWTAEHMRIAACIARYHRGSLPLPKHKAYKRLSARSRAVVDETAAVLRLANAFDREHNQAVQQVRAEKRGSVIVLRAAGFLERSETAIAVAAARYLLEQVTGMPVYVTADRQHAPVGASR